MHRRYEKTKRVVIIVLVAGITGANYMLRRGQTDIAVFFQPLYFVPVILAAFWFGVRGAIATSASITVLYLPFAASYFRALEPYEFESILEVLVFNVVAVILGLFRDREQARLQQFLDAERLAGMGRAVSSVAHDMRLPLVAIGGFVRLVREKLLPDDPDREKLGIVIEETQRLECLIREMLDYSGGVRVHPAPEDVAPIVTESFAVVKEAASARRIRMLTRLQEALPQVCCDRGRIKQMLINLLANAIESSPEGGEVEVRVRHDKSGVILEVVDSGSGIPVPQRHRIFEPFFTTKSSGTGLGLPIVKKIVDAHDGTLQILDNPDRGLTFRIALPLGASYPAEAGQAEERAG